MIILYIVFTQFEIPLIIYKQEEKIMAEFCPECFLKLNPEFTKSDLVIIRGQELCEGCGKIVSKTVLNIKESSRNKLKKQK